MKTLKFILLLNALLQASCGFTQTTVEKQKVAADKKLSMISYSMVHPMHEWTATSNDVNCLIIINKVSGAIEAVAVSVPLATFDSKNSNRDSHALEVLDAIKWPSVKFTSNKIEQKENELTIVGNMVFHNVTKPVIIHANRSNDQRDVVIDGTFIVNITDYQIEVPSLMGLKTKEEITMNFKIVFHL